MKNMLIFGGTFDPIHNGHVNILSEIQKKICFDSITIIPCKVPLLKEASHTSPQHRLQMIKLATKYMQNISIDSQEINRETPSYTVDTLRNIRQSFGTETSITFLMGMDAFLTIEQWHHWHDIFKFASILVVNRPQASPNIPSKLEQFIETRKIEPAIHIKDYTNGKIAFITTLEFDISSSDIRAMLHNGNKNIEQLCPEVLKYIKNHHLYTLGNK